jgi:subtilisin family serine protease
MARGRAIGCGRRTAAVLGALAAAAAFAVALSSSTALASLEQGVQASQATIASAHSSTGVLVGFDRGLSASARAKLRRQVGARLARTFLNGAELLRVPKGRVAKTIAALEATGQVRYAEPDYIAHESATRTPNDPSFGNQWAYQNTGQTVAGVSGTPGDDEKAAAAWSVTTGSRSIVVAEVDTGVDYTHPDLAANIWSNPGGIGGCQAGTHGYNVVSSTCNPMDDDTSYNGHGTHVAGIIGAVGNNGVGVTGVNWTTTILPVKWLDSNGSGTTSGLIAALDWVLQAQAAGVNVRVVNDSATWKGDAYSQALSDEIDLLGQHNILFVSAAGNTGDDNDVLSLRRYPCGYDRPTEICVTASGQNDTLPSWANYGANTVDLAAPGDNIYSTLRNGAYGIISGGSMAAPQVAGTAALILSTGSYTATALKAQILNNVDPVPALQGLVRTGGRLDVCKAIPGCSSGTPPPAPVNTALPAISGTAQAGQTLTASNGSWQNSPTSYAYQWLRCSGSCTAIGGATAATYLVTSADVGATLEVRVTATNAGGSASATSTPTGTVASAPAGSGTFGTTSVGGSSDPIASDRKRVNRYQLSTAASVSKLSIYLQPTGTSGTQVLKGILYADSGGNPGALLGVSNQLSFASTQQAGWYDLVFPSPISLAAGNYWIGLISGATTHIAAFRYSSVSGSRAYNTNTYTSGPSNPFGTPTFDSELMSIYATYSGSGGSGTPAPVNTALPVISGTAQAGQTLTASNGSWQNSPTSYAYQWLRCSSGCSSIGGATAATYQVVSADVGATLEVKVTATNTGGSASATSNPTGTVTAASGGGGGGGPTGTTLLDDFNRANGSLGGNWGVLFGGFTSLQIQNQQAVAPSNKYSWNYWQAQQFGPDSEAYATLATTSSDAVRVCARITNPSTSGRSGYCVHVAGSSWSLIRIDRGSSTTLTSASQSVSAGDRIALTVSGTTLTGWYATATGSWNAVLTTTDPTYTGAGYLALETRATHLDDFGGG